ncbi:toll/interleukin-1 receptor domain-containing protein [Nonomuraea cavernae]|uniref:toll/interleukin-1 receptor domain-containing protein n=1 Tax=Nonomuraea cavernae TaxID=2045107 RepID=UPI0033FE5D45
MSEKTPNTSNMALEVSVFASYAQVDDAATYQRISRIVADIKTTLASQTGSAVNVFKDTESIAAGENWRDRIRLGLSSSTILLAFVSLAYLKSAPCRQEFREFLGFLVANSETRLIIPLIYADFDRVDSRSQEDDIWEEIKKLQVIKMAHMRATDPGSSEWLRAIQQISDRIEEVLASVDLDSADSTVERSPSNGKEEESDGFLELFTEIEEETPDIVADLNTYSELITHIGHITASAAPEITRAQTFGQKLAATRRLADSLTPVSNEAVAISQRILRGLNKWDSGVHKAVEVLSRQQIDTGGDNSTSFLDAIYGLAEKGIGSIGQLDALREIFDTINGVSKQLNYPLGQIKASLLVFAEIRGIFESWKSAIDGIR